MHIVSKLIRDNVVHDIALLVSLVILQQQCNRRLGLRLRARRRCSFCLGAFVTYEWLRGRYYGFLLAFVAKSMLLPMRRNICYPRNQLPLANGELQLRVVFRRIDPVRAFLVGVGRGHLVYKAINVMCVGRCVEKE